MIYRILILLFILSGCNKYYGVKDSIYVPTGEIKYLNKTKFEISKEKIINLEAKNFENSNIFTLPSGNLKTKKITKIKKII